MSEDNIPSADGMLDELRRTRTTAVLTPVGCTLAIAGVLVGVVRIVQDEAGSHSHVFEGVVVSLFSVLFGIVIVLCAVIADALLRDPNRYPR